jgi:hypothetical protein
MAQKCYEEVGRIQREWEEEELRQEKLRQEEQKLRQEEQKLRQEKLRQEAEERNKWTKESTYGCILALVLVSIILVILHFVANFISWLIG